MQFIVILALSGLPLRILDGEGLPVAGASVCLDTVPLAFSDRSGTAELPDLDSPVRIRALGYSSWSGPIPADRIVRLEPCPIPSGVVVTASARRGGMRDLFPSTTLLGGGELEEIALSGIGTLTGRSGGVHAREYGGAMPVVSIAIRGAPAGQASCMVDGHPIESCTDGLPALLPDASLFGSLEVSRGGGSGFLRGGMAGALNFVPETRASPPRASLTADDRGGIHAATAMPAGPGRIAVSLRRTVGAEGSLAHSGSLLWSGTRGLARFGALLSAAGGETEAPDWSVPTDATRSVASLEGWMGWRNDLLGFSADLGARRTQYDSTTPTVSDDDHREGGGSIAADWSPDILPLDLRISAELSGRLARSTSIGERGILTADLALTGTWQGPFTLGGSSRIGFSRDGAPLAGASLTASAPLRGGSLTVHLTGSAGFRRPTLNDLFWPGDAFAVGNPDLGPERSLEVEAGLSMPAGRPLALSLTAFLSVTDDLIRWEPGEGGRWSPVNLGRVRRRGVEAECRAAAGPLSLLGVLTLLEVTDRDPSSTNVGCALPYVPDCTFGLKADLGLPWGLSSWAAVDGVGTRFLNYGATAWLPPYALLSAGLTVPVPGWRGGSLSLSGTNLLDRAYQESNGYGGEPRTLRATLGWEGPGSPR